MRTGATLTAPASHRTGATPKPAWIAVGLLGLLYADTLRDLAARWSADPTYSHGFLVPFLSGWLAWRWWCQAPPAEPQPALGTAELAAGMLIHLAAAVVPWPPLAFVGLVLVLRGLALAGGGRAWARGLAFPILFLAFMIPLPATWTGAVAVGLQDLVSRISAGVLDVIWVCHRQGHALRLAGVPEPLEVAEECSGLRQLVAFLALAALVGRLGLGSVGRRVALGLAAVPAAVAANVLRVLLMAAGARWFGTGWITSWLHHAPALVTLPLGLALLLLAARALGGRWPEPVRRPESLPAFPLPAAVPTLLVAALLAQLMLKAHLQADGGAAFPELTRPLAALPTRLGDWQGRDLPDLASLRARLPFADDVLSRGYTLAEGPAARLYAVYSRAGADREHHPEICVREVGGAAEDPAFAATLYLDAAQRRPVRRFRFRMGTEPAVAVYYWHYTLDAPVREGESLLQGLHRRLSRRAPSVTVQVATTAPPEELPRVERTLLPAVDAALTAAVLPATARPGCERLPIRKVLSIED